MQEDTVQPRPVSALIQPEVIATTMLTAVNGSHSSSSSLLNSPSDSVTAPDPVLVKNEESLTAALENLFSDMDDNAVLTVKDARALRDAVCETIARLQRDFQSQMSEVAELIEERNAEILQKVQKLQQELEKKISALQVINVSPLELPTIPLFTGIGDEKPFSLWLRRLEDIQRIVLAAPTDERKSYFLTAHLDGLARDKVDELPKEARTNYAELRSHLKT